MLNGSVTTRRRGQSAKRREGPRNTYPPFIGTKVRMRDIPTSASHEDRNIIIIKSLNPSTHPANNHPLSASLPRNSWGKKPHYEATGPVAHLLATKGVNKGPRMKSLILALKSPGASGPINV